MVYRTIIHSNIELQIPVIYRADFGLRGFTPLQLHGCNVRILTPLAFHRKQRENETFIYRIKK